MALILSIETSTKVCSIALHEHGELLGCQELYQDKSHSTHLAVMIKQLLENCQSQVKDLDAIAVSKGPGSYTGLRIGVSTAKGLCYALGIPLIGVNTLVAMAHQFKTLPLGTNYLCPMLDARRMEVYCTILDSKFEMVSETRALIVTEDTFTQWGKLGKVLYFGNGSDKCREILNGKSSIFASGIQPSAKTIGMLAQGRFDERQTEDLAYFEPFYLKEFRTTVPRNKSGFINERK